MTTFSEPTSTHEQSAGPVEDFDARPLLARGEEPFQAIMAAASRVPSGGALRLRAPFEPVPLYGVLGQRGFEHATRQFAPDDWEILFTRTAEPESAAPPDAPAHDQPAAAPEHPADLVVRIDVSDLVPPEPMVRILEAAAQLQPNQTLLVEHVRRPVYLYPQLEARGFVHETEELAPDRVVIRIRRGPEAPA